MRVWCARCGPPGDRCVLWRQFSAIPDLPQRAPRRGDRAEPEYGHRPSQVFMISVQGWFSSWIGLSTPSRPAEVVARGKTRTSSAVGSAAKAARDGDRLNIFLGKAGENTQRRDGPNANELNQPGRRPGYPRPVSFRIWGIP